MPFCHICFKKKRIISEIFFSYFKNYFYFSSIYYVVIWSIKINRYARYFKIYIAKTMICSHFSSKISCWTMSEFLPKINIKNLKHMFPHIYIYVYCFWVSPKKIMYLCTKLKKKSPINLRKSCFSWIRCLSFKRLVLTHTNFSMALYRGESCNVYSCNMKRPFYSVCWVLLCIYLLVCWPRYEVCLGEVAAYPFVFIPSSFMHLKKHSISWEILRKFNQHVLLSAAKISAFPMGIFLFILMSFRSFFKAFLKKVAYI